MPINYVYKLKEAANKYNFKIELDTGGLDYNGWSWPYADKPLPPNISHLNLRTAYPEEIEAYDKAKKPVPALSDPLSTMMANLDVHILKMEERLHATKTETTSTDG